MPRAIKRGITRSRGSGDRIQARVWAAFLIGSGLFAPNAVRADEFFSAGFDIAVAIDGEEWSFHSRAQVREDEAIEQELGHYLFAMKIAHAPDGGFNVLFSITDTASEVVVPGGILTEQTLVAAKSILEFNLAENGAAISGAIAITTLER